MRALFSAHAEVFPMLKLSLTVVQSLLRTRGGISLERWQWLWYGASSPHTRRYFPGAVAMALVWRLFSAHAEVFPKINPGLSTNRPLLRTRGGISLHFEVW